MNRNHSIDQLNTVPEFDICIIGGGATGLGIAVDAATRGLKTVLFEQYDFAKGTSSRSTKLVHGGVRYLQQGNIRLVMEALKERGLLLKNAPHLVHNQKFVVPNYKWWEKPFYGIGLKIYDKMAGNLGLGPSQLLSREETLQLAPTLDRKGLKGSVVYHDGQFDDARLAINIAQTATLHGAVLLNYLPVKGLLKINKKTCGAWVKDTFSGKEYEVKSKVVINATGVFTDFIMKMDEPGHSNMICPSQGIHLVVGKEFLPGETAIMIPRTDDGRVLFAVPWHNRIVLGTTDTAMKHIVAEPVPLQEEIGFILKHIGRYLGKQPRLSDVKSVFAGLRPLLKGKSTRTAALARDHQVTISPSGLITITGGKWTTYRKMAEDVMGVAIEKFNLPGSICSTKTLAIYGYDQPSFVATVQDLPLEELTTLVKRATQEEMCMTVEDFLARRSRQLFLDASGAIEVAPLVAQLLAQELGKDENWVLEQIHIFNALAKNYQPQTLNKTL